MKQIIFASRNLGKIKEMKSLLEPFGYQVISAEEKNLPEVEENGQSFADNAIIKAKSAAEICGVPAISDDSGLCIEKMPNELGIKTSRFAQKCGGYPNAFAEIWRQLDGKSKKAHFICTIALVYPDGKTYTFEGRCDGQIVPMSNGGEGFGFDPIFMPDGFDKTFAELSNDIKNTISHRANATTKLKDFLSNV